MFMYREWVGAVSNVDWDTKTITGEGFPFPNPFKSQPKKLVHFQASSMEELEKEFEKSVDVMLDEANVR